ncbi:helix-turn-helix domain-containing protein [Psychroserpens burtonensis]|uniref:Helix-turn-helix domain-containing protein n=1 Tax=Psychroserpens burtonensis TaxID=49278 RepID=A0A5C7B8Y3_9FLAO|nr:helix-turn-helix domain-containing protein [Psychroserpens burtonensis]TXE18578.1 helix-turn-helix domain-containing protein [Psychroserpens burtonensis]
MESNNTEYLTRKEVSELLKVSLGTIQNYVKKGYLKPLSIGRRVLFKRSDVENALISL